MEFPVRGGSNVSNTNLFQKQTGQVLVKQNVAYSETDISYTNNTIGI